MKKLIHTGIASLLALHASYASAAIDYGTGRVDSNLQWSWNDVSVAAQQIVNNLMGFLALIAVFYGLWGGFNILTAGGDEEKVKKGKTVLIQVSIGLVIIFLAYSIVTWVIGAILGTS